MADRVIGIPDQSVDQPASTGILEVLRAARKLPILPVLLLSLVVVVGILAPWVSPHSPTKGDLSDRMIPPF